MVLVIAGTFSTSMKELALKVRKKKDLRKYEKNKEVFLKYTCRHSAY